MTIYVDIFGSDNFHNSVSNPSSRLDDYQSKIYSSLQHLNKYTCEDYYTNMNDSIVVPIHACECDYCSGACDCTDCSSNELEDRVDDAECWLQNNYSLYDSASVCLVVDHHNQCLEDNVGGGIANEVGGVNKNGLKTCLVNNNFSTGAYTALEQIAVHELGHVLGSPHCKYDVGPYEPAEATYMWSPASEDYCSEDCTGASADADGIRDAWSECEKCAIEKNLDNCSCPD